jgi:predicted TPR repeat methyltransferase
MSAGLERAKQHFLEGVRCFEAARFEEAEAQFRQSLALLPGRVSTLTNLAATCLELRRPQEALELLAQALAAAPDDADAWSLRGAALRRLERHGEALQAWNELLRRQPRHAATWFQRARTLQALNRPEEALRDYERALDNDPAFAQAWSNRGALLKDLQRTGEAIECFRRAVALGADPELNGWFLASLTGAPAPAVAPAGYVERLFDDYAADFEEHLVGVLHYRGHRALVEGLQQVARRRFARALDLGCGTGLCAPLLQPLADRIDGVDLSQRMLDQARSRGLYEELTRADLVPHLQSTPRRYDLVVAADVFIYIGELDPVFAGVRRVMDEGVFCFSVEALEDGRDFALQPSQRYAHSERHVRALAQRHGFEVAEVSREAIREDQREAVQGLMVWLRVT